MTFSNPIPFDNTYRSLPTHFYTHQPPSPVSEPRIIRRNPALAELLGIDSEWFASDEAVAVFAGNQVLPNSEPIATVYAGHQFGQWNPQLGDGRAILLGEVMGTDGQRYDIQLKGSGQTPYSRMGDGLSPLGPVLREYILSEAMAAFGIPTTRSLIAVSTGDRVVRDQLLPGAILTRVAKSHIRVGHFQYFSSRNDLASVQQLADHLIARDFPDAQHATAPYQALLQQAIERQATLIAQWQLVGFIHGVMNTDNMLVCGETIDYGPCAFLDEYDPTACFSSIDRGGRYAYQNQPAIARWNLMWLAQSLLPLISDDEQQAVAVAQELLESFLPRYQESFTLGLLKKFGLSHNTEENRQFAQDFLDAMATTGADFTLTFRHLADISADSDTDASKGHTPVNYQLPLGLKPLLKQWQQLVQGENIAPQQRQAQLLATNPAHIPRNHLVEGAINAAVRDGNLQPFQRLVDVLEKPFEYQAENDDLTRPPQPDERVLQTFCGT